MLSLTHNLVHIKVTISQVRLARKMKITLKRNSNITLNIGLVRDSFFTNVCHECHDIFVSHFHLAAPLMLILPKCYSSTSLSLFLVTLFK